METKLFSLKKLFERELQRNLVKILHFKKGKGLMGYLYFRVESILYVMLYVVSDDVDYFREKGYTICEE